jgi:hypothetical protein
MRRLVFNSLLFGLLWMIPIWFLGMVLQMAWLGDECQYHTSETSWLFDLFYDRSAANGYHPWPTWFNLIISVWLPSLYLGRATAIYFSGRAKA